MEDRQQHVNHKQGKVFVPSETGTLKKLLMHRPDEGIEKVTPSRAQELLYEDIVYLPKMQEEHDLFAEAASWFIGKNNLLYFSDLLTEVANIPHARFQLVKAVAELEIIKQAEIDKLLDLPSDVLSSFLISGTIPGSVKQLINPLPNLIFTRDIGTVVNDHLIVAKAARSARLRESLLSFFVFIYHPEFSDLSNSGRIMNFLNPDYSTDNDFCIEGGDLMMFGDNHLLAGCSERTNRTAVEKMAESLFNKGVVEKISFVEMPKERSCMHLDTIFTRLSKEVCIGFMPLIDQPNRMHISHYEAGGKRESGYSSLKDMLSDLYPEVSVIPCGDGIAPYAEREQWTDGCNLFAIKEGVAFTYERNVITNQALQKHGFSIVPVEELIQDFKEDNRRPEHVTNTIVTIPSSELSRARGGTHCLTMPLLRT